MNITMSDNNGRFNKGKGKGKRKGAQWVQSDSGKGKDLREDDAFVEFERGLELSLIHI